MSHLHAVPDRPRPDRDKILAWAEFFADAVPTEEEARFLRATFGTLPAPKLRRRTA